MTNPPRKKGTGGETELKILLSQLGIEVRRTAASTPWDLEALTETLDRGIHEVLATRPDRGEWLVTIRLTDWAEMFLAWREEHPTELHIESKRYARFSLHSIFEKKFGRRR